VSCRAAAADELSCRAVSPRHAHRLRPPKTLGSAAPFRRFMIAANLRNNEALISHFVHQLITATVLLPGKVGTQPPRAPAGRPAAC
jgi:hypothetical protein